MDIIMNRIFLAVLKMSGTASIVIAAVLLARLCLRRAPKVYSYALWALVLFALVCPYKFKSPAGLFPESRVIPESITETAYPFTPGSPSVSETAGRSAPVGKGNMPGAKGVLSTLWAVGAVGMLLYSAVTFAALKRSLRFATKAGGNIYEAGVRAPFALGIFKPKIYIPAGMMDGSAEFILLHERTHIKRFDCVFKTVAYLALALHWFNPLVWFAYFSFVEDMEMSCDEYVIKKLGEDIKAAYSGALLLAAGRRSFGVYPIAFGVCNTKKRIKNILGYKKPSRAVTFAAVAAMMLVTAVTIGFSLDRTVANDAVIGALEPDAEAGNTFRKTVDSGFTYGNERENHPGENNTNVSHAVNGYAPPENGVTTEAIPSEGIPLWAVVTGDDGTELASDKIDVRVCKSGTGGETGAPLQGDYVRGYVRIHPITGEARSRPR
jgi:beta-lactamase regulating signal transducer with metallopeptidase domain